MMRVLQVGKFYPPHLGGIETHTEELCGVLTEKVQLQTVVANSHPRTVKEVIDGVSLTRLANLATVASTPLCPSIFKTLRESDADIIHIHLPNPLAIVAYLLSGHRGKLVVSHHSDIVRQKFLGKAYNPIHRQALDKCSAILVASPNHIEYSEDLPRYRHLCEVIPYGISLEKFSIRKEEVIAEIRQAFGPRMVLSVGRLVYYKGFEYLIDAMKGIDAKLVIIGTGPLLAQLEERARNLGLEDRVRLLGSVPDVVPFFHAADTFVLPSVQKSEAFGIVQLEAMACGVPVVNTDLPSGVPFVSLHNETGFTVPPRDHLALTTAINRILENQELRGRMSRCAVKRVHSEFAAETMGRRTFELYQRVLGEQCLDRAVVSGRQQSAPEPACI